ncbi:hypothetical protein AJ80_01039 [Polytolypa hystricis UAMH7299]|uniref:Serine aminopeptidase S33 domain-containing protein n=1 Tax=Polytolypa hystricis (strain UAMH7299) TaxID=1447883 RepID=A0A2B7Z264_POLH7|nr:hypothetical protein AJ80_01039 [Polytolypa hystricis UAMH7299]
MVVTEEGWHTVPDGTKLYTKTWKTDGPAKAIVAFVHGFSDHCNAYYEFFPTLASHGIEVRAFDQRGWGHSVTIPTTRGLTGSTAVVMSDIHSFLSSIYESLASKDKDATSPSALETETPVFLMGHSMGGGEVLYYVLNSGLAIPPLRGVLAYSPLITLHPSTRPGDFKVFASKLAAKLMPHRPLVTSLSPDLMCRDKRIGQDWAEDPLCHNTGTLEGLVGMFDRGDWLDSEKAGVKGTYDGAVWIGHGTADEVNDYEGSRQLADRLAHHDKTFKSYDGAYHKLHGEPEGVKEAFAKDVAGWILERCGGSATAVNEPSGSVEVTAEAEPSKAKL